MKLAVITDSTAALPTDLKQDEAIFSLDIPVIIDGETYFEGRNLTIDDFYQKMATSQELPKTSQPSLSELDELLGLCLLRVTHMSSGFSWLVVFRVSGKISSF